VLARANLPADTPRVMRKLVIILIVALLIAPFFSAQARDTVLAGERDLLRSSSSRSRPALLALTTPYFGKVAATLTVKSVQRLQSGEAQYLFQGKIRFRGTARSGGARWFPLAASTIVGPGIAPRLELVAPLGGIRRAANRRGMMKASFPWTSEHRLGDLKGRAVAVTGNRLTRQGSCPVHEVGPLSNVPATSASSDRDVHASADRVINISVQADAEYAMVQGGASEARIRSTFNTVDTLYQAQLGTQVHVPTVRIFNNASQPTRSSNAFELLAQFSESNNLTQLLGPADGYMLASGKRLMDGVIGLAAFRRICRGRSSTYGLWESNSDLIDVVIVAHELGHICGAPHEDQAGINIMQSRLGAVLLRRQSS
jgi:Metallo-peptidase family M12B Reprolysin-like